VRGRRSSTTVVFIGAGRLARADVDERGGAPRVEIRGPAPSGGLEIAARTALASGAPGARVVVVDEAAWTRTVDLPAAATEGLAAAEIDRAIAYELEPESGIAASDACVASMPVPGAPDGKRRYWATVVRAGERRALEALLHERGSRLAGIVHPAGLATAADADARRVEVWEQATLVAAPGSLDVFAARAAGRPWQQAIQERLTSLAGSEPIAWRGRARPPAAIAAGVDDRGELPPDLEPWLAGLAPLARTAAIAVPRIGPEPRARRWPSPVLVSAVALLLVAGGAWLDARALVRERDEREGEITKRDSLRREIAKRGTTRADLAKRVGEMREPLQAKLATIERVVGEWEAQRGRPGALLRALGEVRPPTVVLSYVGPAETDGVAVRGIATDRLDVDRFTAALADRLRGDRWDVRPASATLRVGATARPYVEFELALTSRAAVESAASRPARNAAARGRS